MSEDTMKSIINLVPESIDNAAKNLTDKPTQNIGTTFADIWYLVFGGISQAAEKRKLKYSYALQEFECELKEKISKIPEDKLLEPDIQIIAKALEEVKYCIDKEELRRMFSNLITSSLNIDNNNYVHPNFINILKSLSSDDAKLIKKICYEHCKTTTYNYYDDSSSVHMSYKILKNAGLITPLEDLSNEAQTAYGLTYLGVIFCKICIYDDVVTNCFFGDD